MQEAYQFLLERGLVEGAALEPEGEGLQVALAVARDEHGDDGGIKPPAQIGPHRHVRPQPEPHRVAQELPQLFGGLLEPEAPARLGSPQRDAPVRAGPGVGLALPHQHEVAGRKLPYPLEDRPPRQGGPEDEDLGKSLQIQLPWAVHGEDRLDLRGEQQPAAGKGVIEGADADPVPGQEELLLADVPDRQGELAVDPVQAAGAVLLVEMQQHLGVGLGGEAVSLADQLLLELDVVEGLAVIDDPEAAVLVADRLGPAVDADNAQAQMPQGDVAVQVHPRLIRTPVVQGGDHQGDRVHTGRLTSCDVDYSGNSAHDGSFPCCTVPPVSKRCPPAMTGC